MGAYMSVYVSTNVLEEFMQRCIEAALQACGDPNHLRHHDGFPFTLSPVCFLFSLPHFCT